MRRLLVIGLLAVAVTVTVVLATGASGSDSGGYKVRAIFDNAFTLIEGEDVRVSGVNVGKISELEVTDDNRAAVVMDITRPGFDDFRQDASCTIRPQGLIGERFVECTLTQPRAEGDPEAPPLEKIPEGQDGAGQYLLPVERTSKPVDIDLINNITRLPERQRLAIILNELGAGVAGRAEDLNETIRRANPALGVTNQVLEILGEQNRVLRRLATDSDRILEPLSRDRQRVANFVEHANTVSRATAERRADFEANLERLPRFLQELRPTMTRLQRFADEFEPVLSDLRAAAPDINRLFEELGPFSSASIPALESLGDAADVGRPALQRAKPIVDDIRRLTREAEPLASDLADLTTSVRDTGGIERLMDALFFQVAAINGYDSLGHYLRAFLIVNTCSGYSTEPQPGCSARFAGDESEEARASAANPDNVRRAFAARAGEDRSAEAVRARTGGTQATAKTTPGSKAATTAAAPLKLPTDVLPGQGAPVQKTGGKAKASSRPSGDGAPAGVDEARGGLLDYLLGEGS
jgi:virulence factor Mce-like protein